MTARIAREGLFLQDERTASQEKGFFFRTKECCFRMFLVHHGPRCWDMPDPSTASFWRNGWEVPRFGSGASRDLGAHMVLWTNLNLESLGSIPSLFKCRRAPLFRDSRNPWEPKKNYSLGNLMRSQIVSDCGGKCSIFWENRLATFQGPQIASLIKEVAPH